MEVRLSNPYRDQKGKWIRGSFHGHCSENSTCSSVPLAQSVRLYHDIGVGFVTLTDHDVVTDLSAMQSHYRDLVFLQGFEYSTRENVVFAGPEVEPLYQLSLEASLSRAGELLTIVCHPQPYGSEREYWTLEKLVALGVWPDGIEVYNGHYGIEAALAKGRWPLYTELWDELLTAGHRLWGFANDDFHDLADFDNAFNMVLTADTTPSAIVAAAKKGCCYASTGLLLDRVMEKDGHITVEVNAPCTGVFVGPEGVELAKGEGLRFEYRAREEAYVRFQAEGETGRIFLQPMFRN